MVIRMRSHGRPFTMLLGITRCWTKPLPTVCLGISPIIRSTLTSDCQHTNDLSFSMTHITGIPKPAKVMIPGSLTFIAPNLARRVGEWIVHFHSESRQKPDIPSLYVLRLTLRPTPYGHCLFIDTTVCPAKLASSIHRRLSESPPAERVASGGPPKGGPNLGKSRLVFL